MTFLLDIYSEERKENMDRKKKGREDERKRKGKRGDRKDKDNQRKEIGENRSKQEGISGQLKGKQQLEQRSREWFPSLFCLLTNYKLSVTSLFTMSQQGT